MILKLYNCDNGSIDLSDNVAVLEVEPRGVFRSIVNDLSTMCLPAKEVCVIDKDKPVSNKDVLIISDYINIDINNRNILTKVYKFLEKEYNCNLMLQDRTIEALTTLRNVVTDIIMDVNIDFDYDGEFDIKEALDMLGLKILKDDSLINTMIQYINICAELHLYKVIVCVQIKAFLTDEELEMLYRHSLSRGIALILLENHHQENIIKNEKKVFIDTEYCDIIYK